MDENQARVVELLANVAAKLFLALLAGLAFAAVTIKLLIDQTWPLVSAELIMGGIVLIVFKHYFPVAKPK